MVTVAPGEAAPGNHFSCSLTAVALARVHAYGGEPAVAEWLRLAASPRDVAYLSETTNWISVDEANALWQAGRTVTHHPQFPRAVGEDAAKRLIASPVAALLRSLGSPENVLREIAVTSGKFTVVTTMRAVEVGPGYAEIEAVANPGFVRSIHHCEWTSGMLTGPTVLFGLPPATVTHEQCEVFGAPCCRYSVRWNPAAAPDGRQVSAGTSALIQQLDAMRERLRSMFAAASDLIDADDITDVLARIADRAAVEVRAPRYLLAVRTGIGEEVHCHHKGFSAEEASATAQRILEAHVADTPESWLVVPVRSRRRDYGRLLAMCEPGSRFFPQERELFEVYARYAATALDSATALMEAKQRYSQSSALLELARALAAAGTSEEVARRLADAVPVVVDCDRVAVYLWDSVDGRLFRRAVNQAGGDSSDRDTDPEWSTTPTPGGPLERLLAHPDREPIFVDARTGPAVFRQVAGSVDAQAMIIMPLATADTLLGLLAVSVSSAPGRLTPNADLLDRLSGVAAQATSALQNGRLVDQITHQALHDQLTGLANRLQFTEALRAAIGRARAAHEPVQLFYIDLDGFKPVNDEFGHEVGDHLLVAVGERLRSCTRGQDVVARLGGDEFAVLIDAPGGLPDGEHLLDRLARALHAPFAIDGHDLRIGASVGVAMFPQDGADAEELLRHADAAMFASKRERRPTTGRRD